MVSMDERWQKEWAERKAHESDPDNRPKRLITAAFPYPNSPQHIGHGRTYTTADIYARYLRLRGYNVLFPMGFHVTGTPILAMAKRIGEKDPELLGIFRDIYGIPEKTAEKLTDPVELVTYFSKEIEEGMREIGYSMDWRRKFYTFDPMFNRFIQWQFRKLRDAGYLVKGEHPVPWCPRDNNAVSAHDTRGDVDPELEEVTMVKFPTPKGALAATTYRPETIFGVTNIWIDPKAEYVVALDKKNNETLIISREAAGVLAMQMELEVKGPIDTKELLALKAGNPATGENLPVYPASFVDPQVGTGVVMSVPAHAPYDYLALRDMGKDRETKMPQVIEIAGFGTNPAKETVEKLGVKDQDDPKAEEATDTIYKKEAHDGKMLLSKYGGEPVFVAKEKIKRDLAAEGKAQTIHAIANGPVFCRCGALIGVKKVRDQWFINYGDTGWKEKVKKHLKEMRIIPEKELPEYIRTVDWLKEKACTRAKGLGTKFPFDERFIIEALSDSTVYMAFYTISHILKEMEAGGCGGEAIGDAFFDYVLLGKGDAPAGAGGKDWEKARKEFLYWYPVDSRHSAGDLIRNHLPFFVFNHAAIFPKEHWPRQMITNGFVLMDGKKMSKSMGNILPLRKALKEYGADVIRFSVVAGADLTQDTDFNRTVADGARSRLNFMAGLVDVAKGEKKNTAKELDRADRWLYSRLNRRLAKAPEMYEKLQLRELGLELFYETYTDLNWYLKRTDTPKLKEFLQKWCIAISPFMPHHAEEFWHALGGNGLAVEQGFPASDPEAVDPEVERGEELVKQTKEDIEKVISLMKKQPGTITIFIAGSEKRKVYELMRSLKEFGKVMQALKEDKGIKDMGLAVKVAKQLGKNPYALGERLDAESEKAILLGAVPFLSKEFGCPVSIESEDGAAVERAKNALPEKPAIYLE
ncbi:MAG: leucine--tRNA ligase [Candidatus Bilamarchaeaceae archaeon]